MASKVVLIKLTSTPVTLITNNPTTLTQNSFTSLANKNIVVSSHLGVYLLTTIGSSEVSIRTFVPAFISTEPYHNALIVNIFFRKISTISATPSVTFSSLMMTVAMYFGINTGSAEREVEVAVPSICKASFAFLIYKVLDLQMFLGNPFRSQFLFIALRTSLILIFAL